MKNTTTEALIAANNKLALKQEELEKLATELYNINQELLLQTLDKALQAEQLITATENLRLAKVEIENLNESIEEKIKVRTAELVEANKALEAFSYSVSHDLRAPLRSIMGFTKIIINDYGGGLRGHVKDLLQHIESSSRRMSLIIDDLLQLAKIEKTRLKSREANLTILFNETWEYILSTTPHSATLEISELPTVQADTSLLRHVVVNLFSNAIKYSAKKEHPLIIVGYTSTADMITISMKDNGAGFDMKYYNKLFGAFQRLHSNAEFEGTGIGLMLVKRIIERHKGKIWAEAVVDKGATFYFSLPLSKN